MAIMDGIITGVEQLKFPHPLTVNALQTSVIRQCNILTLFMWSSTCYGQLMQQTISKQRPKNAKKGII